MARTDYYNDPDAPAANSVVPSTTAVVTDEHDRIVLIRRRDNDLWALPGGGMELGESIVDSAVREVKETGLDVEVTGLIGVYTNPHHVMAYTDGEVRQQFSLCFTTRLLGGHLLADSKSTDIAWTPSQDIPSLNMHPSMRLRIQHYLEHRDTPYLG
jgi:ADP-ribose pyrophosphatase YjhB (NUDIX family)